MSEPDPNRAIFDEATAAHRAGDLAAAERGYRALILRAPDHPGALGGLGVLCFQTKRMAEAAALLAKAAALAPGDAGLLANLGAAEASLGRQDAAIAALERAVAIDPAHRDAWRNLASLRMNAERWVEAEAAIGRLMELAPDDPDALRRRATVRRRLGRFSEAILDYRRALALAPGDARLWSGLGAALGRSEELAAAIDAYREAVRLAPDRAEHRTHLGNLLRKRGDYEAALAAHREAVALAPERAVVRVNLGVALHEIARYPEALAEFRRATELDPKAVVAWYNLGTACEVLGDAAGALAAFRRAHELDPEDPNGAALLLRQLEQICDWRGVEPLARKVAADTAAALARGEIPAETTLAHLSRSTDGRQNLAIARASARRIEARVQGLAVERAPRSLDPERRLRIGYLSSDFRDHAVGHLTAGIFERHDRARFEVFAYSHGRDDGSAYRKRIAGGVDRFADIASLGFLAAAQRIAADGIDILIELNGFTGGARLEIPALRPAPLQVAWLGYPGSTGLAAIDYLVTDRIVTPPELAADFSEHACRMPRSFQPNDDRQPIADTPLTRGNYGLPENAPVFCSFNQGFKIEPIMFGVWMELLGALPGSALWLPHSSPEILGNLRRAAGEGGIDPARLVFADRPAKELHLKRLGLADLALDTRIYNGHTTTSDALWAGVPVVTLLGRHFASRVSASVLHAVGLPELVAHSLEEYKAIALRYARDPAALGALRAKLARNRRSEPLFDTARLVRALERGYRAMWRRHAAGAAPAAIDVEDEPA